MKVADGSRNFVASITGWTDGDKKYTKGADANLYIKWEPKVTSITLDKGTSGTADGTANVTYGNSALTEISHATKTGYHLLGYYTASSSGTKVLNADGTWANDNLTISTVPYTSSGNWAYDNTSLKLYAQWEIDTYTVSWEANGTPWTGSSHGSPSTNANYNTKPATIPTAPTSAACDGSKVFVGWSATQIVGTTNTFPSDLFTSKEAAPAITGNTTFYAVFATGGTVTFNSSLTGITNSSMTWTHTSSGVEFSLTGTYSTYSSPTWTIGYGSSETYGTITVPSGKYIANVDVTLSNSTNKIVSVSNGTLTTNSTAQYIVFRSSKTTTNLIPATSSTQTKINQLVITYVSSTPAFATACCTQLGGIGASVSYSNPNTAVLTWNAMSNVDATTPYTVTYRTGSAAFGDGNVGSITTNDAGKKTCTITGLSCNTSYDFKIEVTAASNYCDKDTTLTGKNSGKWDVTHTLSNVTLSSGQTAGTGVLCGDYSATFAASSAAYELPSSITVTGASSYTWNKATGALSISSANITGNIAVAITGAVVSNFSNSSTVFIQAESSSAWDASACVKAWFNNSGSGGSAQTTYWLFDASSPDTGKKLFATVVPSSGTLNQVTLQRFASDCDPENFYNNNGTLTKASSSGSNTFRTTGSGNSAVAWNATGVTLELWSSIDSWAAKIADMSDQGSGVWTATYSNYAPSVTSADFKIKTNYNGWIGNTNSNNNATLSGMKVGSTYNVTATLDITDHSLVMSKTYVKGTVSFDMQGHGSAIDDLTNVTAGSKISAPSEPSASGYTFGGWYKEAGCTNAWTFGTDVVNETMTLYAKWTAKTCTITLDNQSATTAGTESVTATYDANTNLTSSITKPTKTGSAFKGYYTETGGGGVQLIDANGAWVAGASGYTDASKNWKYDGTSLTLYAVWGYTVTYANEDGTEISHSDVTAGGSVTLPNQDACVGFEFFGWSTVKITSETTTKPAGASFIGKNGASYTPSRDTTLYPIYKRIDGYTQVKDTLTKAIHDHNGYEAFSGVNKNTSGVRIHSDAVYAGSSSNGNSSIQLNASYGVVTTSSGGNVEHIYLHYNSKTAVDRVTTFYGKASAYSTFSSATDFPTGDNAGTSIGTATKSVAVNNDQSFELPSTGNDFVTQYPFLAFTVSGGAVFLDTVIITWGSGTAYYSTHCEVKEDVTITYNGNGGTPGCGDATDDDASGNKQKTVTWDYKSSGADAPTLASSQTICSSATRSGYVLQKWNTSADGSGRDYTPGATVTRFGGDSTLYAIWRPVYTVEYYDKNEGTPLVASETQDEYGAAVDVPDNPTACSGSWTFVGWTDNANQLAADPMRPNIVVASGTSTYTPTANIKLYAVFSKSYETCDNFAAGVSGTYIISQTSSGTTNYVQATGSDHQYNKSSESGADETAEKFRIAYSSIKKAYTISTSTGYIVYNSGDIDKGSSTPYYWNITSSGVGWKITPQGVSSKWLTLSTYFKIYGSDYTALNFTKATTTYYYTIQSCDATHTIKFHNGGGTINNPASVPVGSWNSSTKMLSGLSDCDKVTKWPTATYEGWNFLGWSPEDYSNSGKHSTDYEDENGSTSEPSTDILYGNDANSYTVLGGNIDLYPVFTRIPNNEPFDTDEGGDYVMYYLESGSDDGYGAEVRVYAGAYEDNKRYQTASSCASARVFTFTKDGDVWHIYDNTAEKYIAGVSGDNDLVYRSDLSGDYDDWTIEVSNGNQFDAYCQGGGRYISFSTTAGKFANYSVTASPTLYKQVYLGSCEERIFSSEPNATPILDLSGEPTVTSSSGQTIRAATPFVLTGSHLGDANKVTLTGTNLKFATSTTATPVASLEVSVTSESVAATNIYVYYTPTATSDGTENIIVTASATTSSSVEVKRTTSSVYARHLPANFVIAAQASSGKWYALPADITSSSSSTAGVLIEVDDDDDPTSVTSAPENTQWGLRNVQSARQTTNGLGHHMTFTERLTTATANSQKTLYNGSGTGVQAYAKWSGYASTNPEQYEWVPTTTDLKDYTLTSAKTFDGDAGARTLSMNTSGVFGTLLQAKAYDGKVRLLPAEFYTTADAQIVEWKANSVVVMYTGSQTSATTKVGTNSASSSQTLTTHKLTHGIYELTTSQALTSNDGKKLELTFGTSEKLIVEIPVIISGTSTAATGHASQDLIILKDAKLTAAATKYDYRNVYVYGGGKLNIPTGTSLGVNNIILRAGGITTSGIGSSPSAAYDYVYPQVFLAGTLTSSVANIKYEYITDYTHWYHLCLPFNATLTSIHYPQEYYGDNVAAENHGSWQIKRYDGATRATGDYAAWKDIEADSPAKTEVTAGVGYIYWGAPKKVTVGTTTERQAWGIQRMTMPTSASAAVTAETANKTVSDLSAYYSGAGQVNDQGWNLIGNPYMVNLTGLTSTSIKTGALEKEMVSGQWTGRWTFNSSNSNRYITVPDNHFETYEAVAIAVSDMTLTAGRAFFVQLADAATAVEFDYAKKAALAPAWQQAEQTADIETGVVMSSETMKDEVNFWIKDGKTAEYEFNADYPKTPNQTNFNIYGVHETGKLSWIAVSPEIAEGSMAIGYQVPAAGDYTLSLSEKFPETDIEALFVTDHAMSPEVTTNLLLDDYTFTVNQAESNDERFTVSVKLKKQTDVVTDIGNGGTTEVQAVKFIHNDKLYILRNGLLYDATGKRVNVTSK
ncbi:MAG: InlB B-repeat-containing protein [Paludibacteraceae bacterium]|nr:InlB B-repeat-containing protein [Paludibacteraceae bacterium]